jgi:thioredoxin reductase
MAAGVYGSSEGLSVLIVERCAAGGKQAHRPVSKIIWGFQREFQETI